MWTVGAGLRCGGEVVERAGRDWVATTAWGPGPGVQGSYRSPYKGAKTILNCLVLWEFSLNLPT